MVEETDQEAIYEFRLHPTIDFRRALLSFGEEVEVLEPQWLRDWFADQADALDYIYNSADRE